MKKFILWGGLLLGLCMALALYEKSLENSPSGEGIERVDSLRADKNTTEVPSTLTEPASNWTYSVEGHKMGDTAYVSEVKSANTLNFNVPYHGGSTGYFAIITRAGKTRVVLRISKGQFMATQPEGRMIRIRLDEHPPEPFYVSPPEDQRTNYVYYQNASPLVKKIRTSKRMVVEALFYQEGKQRLLFNVEGLK